MAVSDEELSRLKTIVGYGNPEGPVWFLGMEEGQEAATSEDAEADLRLRSNLPPVVDMVKACKILKSKLFRDPVKLVPTWRVMCELMLRAGHSRPDAYVPQTEEKREFLKNHLGHSGDSTFLCELLPIAKPRLRDWHPTSVLPQFVDKDDYVDRVIDDRVQLLRSFAAKHKPRVVVAHGKHRHGSRDGFEWYWRQYSRVFEPLVLSDVGDGESSIKVGRGETTVIFTPQLQSRAINNLVRPWRV